MGLRDANLHEACCCYKQSEIVHQIAQVHIVFKLNTSNFGMPFQDSYHRLSVGIEKVPCLDYSVIVFLAPAQDDGVNNAKNSVNQFKIFF